MIMKVEGLYHLCSENKGADQLRGHRVCVFVFAYAKSRFSHTMAHLWVNEVICLTGGHQTTQTSVTQKH